LVSFFRDKKHNLLKNKFKKEKEDMLRLIQRFNEGWRKLEKEPYILIVSFKDIVLDSEKTINKILNFWKKKPINKVELMKKRFTGIGVSELKNR
jgi:hypothetical protein